MRLRGLPFTCTADQVMDFLDGFTIEESSVLFTTNAEGRPSGEAYVRFHSTGEADRAFDEKQHQHMGSRYVELFRASQDEWSQAKKASRTSKGGGGGGGCSSGPRTSYPTLRLRGLPFTSGPADVVKFLDDYGVERADVVMGIGTDGRPSGEAFVIFPDDNAASRALEEKQNEKVGSRYIELFNSNYDEWKNASESSSRGGSSSGCGGGWGMMWPGFGPWGPWGMGGWGDWSGGKGGSFGRDGPYSSRSGSGRDRDGGSAESSDPRKQALVDRIKQIQRNSIDDKESWWSYCDSEGRGIRDPNRHDADFLKRFLDQYR